MPGSTRRHLITGASAGMAACASALAARGDAVIAVARRADVLSNRFGDVENVTVVAADVGHADGRSAILEVVTNQTDDPLTSVIHGAASAVELQPWHQLDPDALTAHFHVHVASSIAITGSVHNQVGVERCVIFDSYSASTPRVGWSAYSILKAAAQMAFRAAAEELEGGRDRSCLPRRSRDAAAGSGTRRSPIDRGHRGVSRTTRHRSSEHRRGDRRATPSDPRSEPR